MSTMSQAETSKRFGIVAGGFVASIFVCVIVGSITGYNAALTKAPATVDGLKADHIIAKEDIGYREGRVTMRFSKGTR
jgi:hypothetical protein